MPGCTIGLLHTSKSILMNAIIARDIISGCWLLATLCIAVNGEIDAQGVGKL